MTPDDFFEAAFWKLVRDEGLAADPAALKRLLPKLRKRMDDPRQAVRAIQECLSPGAVAWPAYQDFQRLKGEPESHADLCRLIYCRLSVWQMALYRNQQMRECRAPYLEFRQGLDARPECAQMDGMIRKADDPCWATCPLPCAWLECGCRVFALWERDLRRMGYSPPVET